MFDGITRCILQDSTLFRPFILGAQIMVTHVPSCPRKASSGKEDPQDLLEKRLHKRHSQPQPSEEEETSLVGRGRGRTQRPFDIPFLARSAADKFFHEVTQPL